jgi:hypothetical protein
VFLVFSFFSEDFDVASELLHERLHIFYIAQSNFCSVFTRRKTFFTYQHKSRFILHSIMGGADGWGEWGHRGTPESDENFSIFVCFVAAPKGWNAVWNANRFI